MARLACLATLALCLAGCGGGYTRSTSDAAPAGRPVPARETSISGGSAAQRAVLREVLDRLGATGIESVSIEPPGDEWKPHGPDDVLLRMSWADQRDSQANWEASILAGAFGDRSRAEGLPEVVAFQGPGGGSRIAGLPGQTGLPPQRPEAPAAAAVEDAVRAAADKQGATITSLSATMIDGRPVARVSLVIDGDAARFLKQRLPLILAALPSTLGGRFVELHDRGGEKLFETGWFTTGDVNGGLVWTKPSLDACSPVTHSQPAGLEPPACPYDGPVVYAPDNSAPSLDVDTVVRIAEEQAHPDERVELLGFGTDAAKLCQDWRASDCPGHGHDPAWLARIAPRSGNTASTRFVLIDDGDGHVIASGRLR